MSSIKQLKKAINNLSDILFTECMFSRIYLKNANTQTVDKIIIKILEKQDEFLKRSKHTDGKNNPVLVKKYYKRLREDINQYKKEIITEIENIHN